MAHFRYTVDHSTAAFNAWGWQAGCAFATASCPALVDAARRDDTSLVCDEGASGGDRMCNADRTALGRCMEDAEVSACLS